MIRGFDLVAMQVDMYLQGYTSVKHACVPDPEAWLCFTKKIIFLVSDERPQKTFKLKVSVVQAYDIRE